LAITSVLAACGGGGDSGSGSPIQTAPTLALTTANRDLVSHDAAAGVMALSATTSIPLGSPASVGSGVVVQRAGMASSWSGRSAGSMLERLRFAMPAAGRQHALAVTPPSTVPCMVSGWTTTTVDDRDDNGYLSVGDFGTVVFQDCRDTATETINGTTTLLISGLGPTDFAAHATLTNMSTVTTGHSLTIDGSMLMEISTPDGVHTAITTTAEGPVQATISTHVPFSDTVTLQDGFVVEETIDTSLVPPIGAGTTPGRTLTTLSGRMRSASANGTFDVKASADAPITRYHAENYPRAGVLRVGGASGVLVLTTTSVNSVVLDLDWNDDGRVETSEAKTWDWLI
jgi:hypothetical protein